MDHHEDLVDRYIAGWNEADPERRRALVAGCWTEGASYLDPRMRAEGHDDLAALIAAVQAQLPGHRFRRLGAAEAHHDRLRFSWALEPEAGPAVARGTDFAVLAADGRLQAVTGFFDALPAGVSGGAAGADPGAVG